MCCSSSLIISKLRKIFILMNVCKQGVGVGGRSETFPWKEFLFPVYQGIRFLFVDLIPLSTERWHYTAYYMFHTQIISRS